MKGKVALTHVLRRAAGVVRACEIPGGGVHIPPAAAGVLRRDLIALGQAIERLGSRRPVAAAKAMPSPQDLAAWKRLGDNKEAA